MVKNERKLLRVCDSGKWLVLGLTPCLCRTSLLIVVLWSASLFFFSSSLSFSCFLFCFFPLCQPDTCCESGSFRFWATDGRLGEFVPGCVVSGSSSDEVGKHCLCNDLFEVQGSCCAAAARRDLSTALSFATNQTYSSCTSQLEFTVLTLTARTYRVPPEEGIGSTVPDRLQG